MELGLQKARLNYYKKIVDSTVSHEETMEMIVPDSFPDVREILDTCGTVILRSKEAQQGKLTVSGIVQTYVVFCPEGESGVRSLNTQIPFSVDLDCAEASTGTRLVVACEQAQLEGRIINSRKLLLRAELTAEFKAYAAVSEELTTGIEGKEDVELLCEDKTLAPIIEVREKTFTVSEEYSFPAANPPVGRIISATVRLAAEDVKPLGTKLAVKGSAFLSVVYTAATSGEVCSVDFSLPFSQVVELPEEGREQSCRLTLMPTGLYVQDTGTETTSAQGLVVELAAVAQLCLYADVQVACVSDLYSVRCQTEYDSAQCEPVSLTGRETLRDTARFTLAAEGQVRSIVSARAVCGRIRRTDNELLVPITACVLFLEEGGELRRCTGRFEFAFQAAYGGVEAEFSLACGEVYATPAAGGIELRIPLELTVLTLEPLHLEYVSAVRYNEEQVKDPAAIPSLIVRRVGAGDSIWSLARQYNSTRERIRRANGLEDGEEVRPGELVILAKQR